MLMCYLKQMSAHSSKHNEHFCFTSGSLLLLPKTEKRLLYMCNMFITFYICLNVIACDLSLKQGQYLMQWHSDIKQPNIHLKLSYITSLWTAGRVTYEDLVKSVSCSTRCPYRHNNPLEDSDPCSQQNSFRSSKYKLTFEMLLHISDLMIIHEIVLLHSTA